MLHSTKRSRFDFRKPVLKRSDDGLLHSQALGFDCERTVRRPEIMKSCIYATVLASMTSLFLLNIFACESIDIAEFYIFAVGDWP
jgi:hypothetical protein